MVSDGVLLIQKLLKLFPFDAFCIAHEYNKLAAILQGKLGNAVLTDTEICSSFRADNSHFSQSGTGGTAFLVYVSLPDKELGSELMSSMRLNGTTKGVECILRLVLIEFSSFVIKVSVNNN